MRLPIWRFCILLFMACVSSLVWAGGAESVAFIVRFDSRITSTGENLNVTTHVVANFLVDPVEGTLGLYRGTGRLRYTELVGLSASASDGVLTVLNMQVSPNDGTVVIDLIPGEPIPNEWLVAPPGPPTKFFHWLGLFGLFHEDEFGPGGYAINNFEYPSGEVYARKTYDQNTMLDVTLHEELTIIELTPVDEPPRIDKMNIESTGSSAADPETGKKVNLSADLFVPFPFEVQRCTWTGNNFTGPGTGDPDNDCMWSYTPQKSEGPKRETYGDKDLKLDVVYRFGTDESAVEQSKSEEYKVFFAKKGDDNSNSQPNWFDYWGDDEAVPGLDDSNVKYKASLSAIAEADGTDVTFGPVAADSDGSIMVPATANCPGGTFPGAQGIDLTAISLAHERKHNELDAIGGTDTDNDGVPDSAEAGTSPMNPDSCNLAGVIHSSYATYGDHEYIARLAELGVKGVAKNDWALPGRQATVKTPASRVSSPVVSGLVSTPHTHRDADRDTGVEGTQGLDGILTGVYNSQGQDTDSDDLFNALLLDVEVNVVEPDIYSVVAWLADDEGADVVWAKTEANLGTGTQTVQLVFDGAMLNKLGVSQPLEVSLVELYAAVGKHQVLQDSAENVHVTTYVSADFDPPAAVLVGVHSELPVDEVIDGLYDSLDFTIDLRINDPGTYELSAQLIGGSMSLPATRTFALAEGPIERQSISTPLGVGNAQVVLSFEGASIFYHREDGPYDLVQLRVIDLGDDTELDFQAEAWTTATYLHTEFQQSGIVIDETSYADMGGELDGEGKFTTLEVTFNIGSMDPGPYIVHGRLEDSQGKTIARTSQNIGLGGVEGFEEIAMAQLSFEGMAISSSGEDGPYRLADVTVISDAGVVMDQNPTPYLTGAYLATDFSGESMPGGEVIFDNGFE